MRIGIVAPSCRLDPDLPARLTDLAQGEFGVDAPELVFHPQCFLSAGHFAGPDAVRIDALVDYANDPAIDALWFARGGYGACRVAEKALQRFGPAAHKKHYMGFSDAGYLLGGLQARGIGTLAHGPMPADLNRLGGEGAVLRALRWFLAPTLPKGPPQLAFNMTVLSQMISTPLAPDFAGRVLMLEEVSEYMYRIDRTLFHLTNTAAVRSVAGIRLGRCSLIPENDPDFGQSAEQLCAHWCHLAGIPFLGRADIGHDSDNAIIAFG
jgi:muramoyltetrapeptide carboxypeptidase